MDADALLVSHIYPTDRHRWGAKTFVFFFLIYLYFTVSGSTFCGGGGTFYLDTYLPSWHLSYSLTAFLIEEFWTCGFSFLSLSFIHASWPWRHCSSFNEILGGWCLFRANVFNSGNGDGYFFFRVGIL